MKFRLPAVLYSVCALLASLAAVAGQTGNAEQEPRYDPSTVVNISVTVTDLHEVARDRALSGLHLAANTEKDTAIEVYVAPLAYLKEIQQSFAKGERLQVLGSKVKFGEGQIVLVREVHRGSDTMYFRDSQGRPYWTAGQT